MLSSWHDLLFLFCFLLFYLLPSMGWLCGVGVFGLIVFSLSPGLAQRTEKKKIINCYMIPNINFVTLLSLLLF